MKKRMVSFFTSLLMVFSLATIMPGMSASATQDRSANFSKSYALTGNGANDIVAVAMAQKDKTKAQLGYTEAWCADFVSDCARLAGISNKIPANGYCGTLYTNIKNAGGKEVTSPQKGDIIFYYCTASSCPNSGKPWVHVGIMTGSGSSIEGNSGGKVSYKSKVTYTDANGHTYNHSGTNLVTVKYLRPNYQNAKKILPGTIDSGWNVPANVTASKKISTYNEYGNVESDHYIDSGDNCYVSEVYTNGFVKVQYPITGGKRWAYAKRTDFSLTKKESYINLGNDFKALIINTNPWKPILLGDNGNVVLGSEKRTNFDKTLWHFIRNKEDGTYTIWSYYSGKPMYVNGGKNADSVIVKSGDVPSYESQAWYIIKRSDGSLGLKPKCSSIRVLDIAGGATTDGTPVQIYTSNNSSAQCFSIYMLDSKRDVLNYKISAAKTTANLNEKVNITVGGNTPYVYNYKFHIIDPSGKETVIDNKCNFTYGFTGTKVGKYVIYAEIKSPILTEKGSKTSKCVTINVENVLSVSYNANGGKITSDTYKLNSNIVYKGNTKFTETWKYDETHKNGLTNAKTFGLTKEGYTFKGWGTTASGGTIFDQDDTTVKPSQINANVKKGNCSTTLYAIWTPNVLTVNFNANGGKITSDTYKLNNNIVYKGDTKFTETWKYEEPHKHGLTNATTFGLTKDGYTFKGWSTSSNGSATVFNDHDNTVVPSQINANVKKGNCSTTLYAIWEKNHVHSYTSEITKQPTCTSAGVKTFTCSCGDEYTETINAAGHTAVTDNAVAATCTTAGKTEGSHCSKCNAVIKTQTDVPAKGHTYSSWNTTKAATCTAAGSQTRKCSVCGNTETKAIAKLSHTPSGWITVKAPSVGVSGLMQKKCTVCGTQLETMDIPAIEAKKLSACKITLSSSSAYFRGTRVKSTVTVKDGDTVLKSGTDYTVAYYNNLSVGTASVKITGKGNYAGTVTKTYTIKARNIANCDIELAQSKYYFTGARVRPAVKSVKIGDTELYSGNYKIVSYTDNLSTGTAKIVIQGKNNLTGTVTKTFKINPRSVATCDVKLTKNPSNKYKPTVAVSYFDREIYNGNYTVSYVTSADKKTVKVTLTGKNNLSGKITKTYTVS